MSKFYKKQRSMRLRWTEHLTRWEDVQWTKAVTELWPRGAKREVGIPPIRWSDDIVIFVGSRLVRMAQNLDNWRKIIEA